METKQNITVTGIHGEVIIMEVLRVPLNRFLHENGTNENAKLTRFGSLHLQKGRHITWPVSAANMNNVLVNKLPRKGILRS